MINNFGLNPEDLKKIIKILQKFTVIKEAIIFGSRAKGSYKRGSDVDIAVKGRNIDFRTVSEISFLLNEETVMPYNFDIINYATIKNRNLKEHINRVGKVFYKCGKLDKILR